MKKISAYLCFAALSGMAAAQTTLVGGAVLNGDFNLPGTAGDVLYSAEPYWVNTGSSGASAIFLKDTLDLDGTHNAMLPEGPGSIPALDTGYDIVENDLFSISYQWRDAWQWNDGADQIMVRLFVTDSDLITGTPSNLVSALSGTSTVDNVFELFDEGVLHADASVAGKRLFVALDTQDGNGAADGYARLDNFELTVVPFSAPVYYIAAAGNNSNNGLSPATAWKNVDALDGKTFGPGEKILFNRGGTFTGATTLLGNGSAGLPIVVGAYGTGVKPLLTGVWNEEHIFRLTDNEYVEFQDLRMSNFNTNNSSIKEREVIMVEPPAGSGELNHLHFRNLDIFDVQGYGRTVHEDDHRSYAIWLQTVDDDTSPTRFNDVRCVDCTFTNIDGRCFSLNDKSQSLADVIIRSGSYFPSINGSFENNYATNVYRNMAMVSGTQGFLVQGNIMDTTVEGSAFWPFDCEDTLVQYNLFMNLYAFDADAYVCHFDYNCIGTIMQYNTGINVEGGLIEYIVNSQWSGYQENGIARYNVGIDVGWRNKYNGAGILLTGRVTGGQFYNNTIVQITKPMTQAITFNNWGGAWPDNNEIYNNIFYAAAPGSPGYYNAGRFDDLGNVLSHNLYHGTVSPPAQDVNPFTGNPMFANPSGQTPADFKVTYGSAAIASGLVIPGNGGIDYFSNAVSAASAPTLGFHEYSSDATIDSDGDAMFDQWEIGYSLNPGSAADALVHSDSDTLVNLVEFALGGDPTDGNDTGHPQTWSPDAGSMKYIYPRRIGSTLSFWLETCDNLVSNSWAAGGYTELGAGILDADFESVTNMVPLTEESTFIRLRIE